VPSSAQQITTTPAFTAQSPTSGVVGTAYSYTFAASGYRVTYAVVAGALPAGLSLNGTSGIVSGTPTTRGQTPVTVSATNDSGTVTTSSLSIAIQQSQTVTINDPGTQTYSVGGSFSVSGSATSGLSVTYGARCQEPQSPSLAVAPAPSPAIRRVTATGLPPPRLPGMSPSIGPLRQCRSPTRVAQRRTVPPHSRWHRWPRPRAVCRCRSRRTRWGCAQRPRAGP
jgi:Putative Ig domain